MLTKTLGAPPLEQDGPMVQEGTAYMTYIERHLAPYFERAKPRQRAMAYLQGLRVRPSARTAGKWLKSAAMPHPMAFITCYAGTCGTRMPFARTCAVMRCSIWRTQRPCWWSTKPASGNKAATRPGWRANTAGPLGVSRTARSVSCWAMLVSPATPCWIGSFICLESGRRTPRAASRLGFQQTAASQLSRTWLTRCWPGPLPVVLRGAGPWSRPLRSLMNPTMVM